MEHIKFLTRCLQLANYARGSTSPNPMVGAVIVHKGIIIGEGYHKRAGHAHAEACSHDARERYVEPAQGVAQQPQHHTQLTRPVSEDGQQV